MGDKLEQFGGKHKNVLLIVGTLIGVLALVMMHKGTNSSSSTPYIPVPVGSGSSSGSSADTAAITSAIQQGQQAQAQQLQSLVDSQNAAAQQTAQTIAAGQQQQQQIDAANASSYQQALQDAQSKQTDALSQAIQSFSNQMSANNQQLYSTLQSEHAQQLQMQVPQAVYAPAQQQYQAPQYQGSSGGSGGTIASDGQSLASQSAQVQKLFFGTYGSSAATDWVQQHNAAIGG